MLHSSIVKLGGGGSLTKIIPHHITEHLSISVFSEILSFNKAKILKIQHILDCGRWEESKADLKCDHVQFHQLNVSWVN